MTGWTIAGLVIAGVVLFDVLFVIVLYGLCRAASAADELAGRRR